MQTAFFTGLSAAAGRSINNLFFVRTSLPKFHKLNGWVSHFIGAIFVYGSGFLTVLSMCLRYAGDLARSSSEAIFKRGQYLLYTYPYLHLNSVP